MKTPQWLADAINRLIKIILTILVLCGLVALYLAIGLINTCTVVVLVLLALGLIVLVAFNLANKNIIFTRIESNHLCCAEIDGQFYAFFCHSLDKAEILNAHEAEAKLQGQNVTDPSYTKARGILDERIITRDKEGGITGWLVDHFNLHLMTLNPFVTLRKIKVIRTHINSEDTSGELPKMITIDKEEEEYFLRIKWPRPVYIGALELEDNVQTNLVATNTEFTVIDPYPIFYKNQEISRWADLAMRAAFINQLGKKKFADFATDNFTATNIKFTKSIAKEGGFDKLGLSATGKFSIVDWDLAGSQAELKRQLERKASASASSDADIEAARGTVEVIKMTGEAKANAAELLRNAIGGDPSTALVLASENLNEGGNTVILGNTGVMPTVNVGNTKPNP